MTKRILLSLCAVGMLAVPASAVVLFSDDFDADTSASWNILTSSADTSTAFAFDYSAIGVPPSPNGGGSTLGLRMGANIASPQSSEAVTLTPMGENFTGTYMLTFDMWINANGPFPGGGGGSTEFLTAGIGHDDTTVNRGGASGSGGWFAPTGEGGSSRDYRAYKNAGEQFAESGQFSAGLSSAGGGAHNASDPYYAGLGGIDVETALPVQNGLHAQQTGTTQTGSAGMDWHEVAIIRVNNKVYWRLDGLNIATLNNSIGSSFPLEGNISVGYMDIFGSVSDNDAISFGLIDNLEVTDAPEPGTLALLGMGGLALLRRRRR